MIAASTPRTTTPGPESRTTTKTPATQKRKERIYQVGETSFTTVEEAAEHFAPKVADETRDTIRKLLQLITDVQDGVLSANEANPWHLLDSITDPAELAKLQDAMNSRSKEARVKKAEKRKRDEAFEEEDSHSVTVSRRARAQRNVARCTRPATTTAGVALTCTLACVREPARAQ